MAIDGIGQRNGSVGELGSSIASHSEAEKFDLLPDSVARALPERGRSDISSVDHYLDSRVTEALRHLEHPLTSEMLSFVGDALREHIADGNDPVVAELARRATGRSF